MYKIESFLCFFYCQFPFLQTRNSRSAAISSYLQVLFPLSAYHSALDQRVCLSWLYSSNQKRISQIYTKKNEISTFSRHRWRTKYALSIDTGGQSFEKKVKLWGSFSGFS